MAGRGPEGSPGCRIVGREPVWLTTGREPVWLMAGREPVWLMSGREPVDWTGGLGPVGELLWRMVGREPVRLDGLGGYSAPWEPGVCSCCLMEGREPVCPFGVLGSLGSEPVDLARGEGTSACGREVDEGLEGAGPGPM